MPQAFSQVDAFSDVPFAGNPAAVCILETPRSEDWMQCVAREMNLSETAFLLRQGEGRYGLRWFTPAVEVDLCGHATLASAHVLWEDHEVEPGRPILFSTRSGELTARSVDGWIEMNLPSDPPRRASPSAALREALGADPEWFGRSRLYDFALVDSESTLRELTPRFDQLRGLVEVGICVTAQSDAADVDFVSRFFAPAAGIDEDPVTGSAHCLLAPFWSGRLERRDLVGFQASERGGTVRVGDRGERILVAGQAVTVARGELLEQAPGPVPATGW